MPFPANLVRLYLRWPDVGTAETADEEVAAFSAWVLANHPEALDKVSDEDIALLVKMQREKSGAKTAGRREPRIKEQIQVRWHQSFMILHCCSHQGVQYAV